MLEIKCMNRIIFLQQNFKAFCFKVWEPKYRFAGPKCRIFEAKEYFISTKFFLIEQSNVKCQTSPNLKFNYFMV